MSAAAGPARQEAEAVPLRIPEPGSMPAEARGRATSVTDDRTLPSIPRVAPATDSDAIARAQAAAAAITAWAGGVTSAVQSGALVTWDPSSLADARERVHAAAAGWEALAVRVPRLLWGYGWLGFKAVLHLIEWVTESPVRFVIAAVLVAVAWFFH